MKKATRVISFKSQEATQIDDEEQRHLLTLEALAEVEAGEVIEHTAIQAWAKSLSKLAS
ncbi:MAG: hypothetical protein WBD10_10665 [Acidobacteriaceae bacterium]